MSMRSVAVGALRQAAALKDRVRPPKPGTAVLLYHRVGARTSMSADLPRARFADQMAKIAERAVTLDDALTGLEGPTPEPESVVVTFDDGTADVIEVALPVCVEHGVPMLLYLATRFVEDQIDFPSEGRPTLVAGAVRRPHHRLPAGGQPHPQPRAARSDRSWRPRRTSSIARSD